jgi:antitoxin ParD1/3/4
MRTTQQLSITLPNELAEVVKSKVSSGEYATESEVIRDGLRSLMARDRAIDDWLRSQVGPAYDALKADPSRAVSAEHVLARLAAEHKKVSRWDVAYTVRFAPEAEEVQTRNAAVPAEQIESEIEEALVAVRAERFGPRKPKAKT